MASTADNPIAPEAISVWVDSGRKPMIGSIGSNLRFASSFALASSSVLRKPFPMPSPKARAASGLGRLTFMFCVVLFVSF